MARTVVELVTQELESYREQLQRVYNALELEEQRFQQFQTAYQQTMVQLTERKLRLEGSVASFEELRQNLETYVFEEEQAVAAT